MTMHPVAAIGRVCLTAVAVIASAIGVFVAAQGMGDRAVIRVAAEIADGARLTSEAARRVVDTRRPRHALLCRADVLRARCEIGAGALERIVRDGDVARVRAALSNLEERALELLACRPADGAAWVWTALVRDHLGADTEEVAALYRRSSEVDPADLWVIALRLPQAAQARSRRGPALDAVIERDIDRLFVSPVSAEQAVSVIAPVTLWIGHLVGPAIDRLRSGHRRNDLRRSFARRGIDIGGCGDVAMAEWQKRGYVGACGDTDPSSTFSPWGRVPSR